MVPASALSVAVFLLLVAPGTCYELLRQRTRHPRGESAFVEVSRILLAGMLITALALALLAAVHLVAPLALLDLPTLLLQGRKYVAGHVMLTGWSVAAELVLATLLAVVINDLRTARDAQPIFPVDPWHGVAELLAKPGQEVGLSVRLKDGTEIVGFYVGCSTEPEPAKRELVLGSPFHVRHPGADVTVELNAAWQRMVISGAEISHMSTAYVGEGVNPPMPRARRRIFQLTAWLRRYCLTWRVALPLIATLLITLLVVGWTRSIDLGLLALIVFAR